jgi:hypothetical protein
MGEFPMKMKLLPALLVCLCLPSLAHAEAYKCKKPDGSLAFQDHPCQNGGAGTKVNLAPVQGYAAVPVGQSPATPAQRLASPVPVAPSGNSRAAQLEQLKAANDDLQASAARMRAENPNWQHSQSLTRLNAEAEAINARVQADTQKQ